MYPTNIKPTAHKQRKHKESYCQRLARNLDRFDQHPRIWQHDWYNTTPPPILQLPPELRQSIMFEYLADDELYVPRPNLHTQTLSLVCRTFAEDVQATKVMWDVREQELRRLYGFEKAAFCDYISDLMGPLRIASAALSTQTDRGYLQFKKEKNNRSHNRRRKAEKAKNGTRRGNGSRRGRIRKHDRAAGKSERASLTVDEICAMMKPGYIDPDRAERLRHEVKTAEIGKLQRMKKERKAVRLIARKGCKKTRYEAKQYRTDALVSAEAARRSLSRTRRSTPSRVKTQSARVRRIEAFEHANGEWIQNNPELARVKILGFKRRTKRFSSISEAFETECFPGGRVEIDFDTLPELKENYGRGRQLNGIYALLETGDVECVVNEPMREIALWRKRAVAE